jgi:hypothetical protein
MNSPRPQRIVPTSFYPQMPLHVPNTRFPASYHPSSAMEGSLNRTPVPVPRQEPNSSNRSAFNDLQGHRGRQDSPEIFHHAQPRPLSGGMSQLQGQQTIANTSPSCHVHEQGSPPEILRLQCTWDKAFVTFNLDLHAPAETFLIILEKKFKPSKKVLDRSAHFIRFMDSKDSEGSCCLTLEEHDFVNDWPLAIDWIRANKSTIGSHLYAMIELEGD